MQIMTEAGRLNIREGGRVIPAHLHIEPDNENGFFLKMTNQNLHAFHIHYSDNNIYGGGDFFGFPDGKTIVFSGRYVNAAQRKNAVVKVIEWIEYLVKTKPPYARVISEHECLHWFTFFKELLKVMPDIDQYYELIDQVSADIDSLENPCAAHPGKNINMKPTQEYYTAIIRRFIAPPPEAEDIFIRIDKSTFGPSTKPPNMPIPSRDAFMRYSIPLKILKLENILREICRTHEGLNDRIDKLIGALTAVHDAVHPVFGDVAANVETEDRNTIEQLIIMFDTLCRIKPKLEELRLHPNPTERAKADKEDVIILTIHQWFTIIEKKEVWPPFSGDERVRITAYY
jgi:hypothetical protein